MITFEICVANRYKLNKQFKKQSSKLAEDPENLALRASVAQSKLAAVAETEDNETEQKRQQGRKVLYGQIVQLRHVFSSKYIHVSTTKTSETESSNMAVELLSVNAKHAQFRIMPRYKVKAEGDTVQVEDQIMFESVKSAGSFLHVSKFLFPGHSVYHKSHELNLSVQTTGFVVYRKYKPIVEEEERLKIGEPVRFFHKEMEAYLVAEGLFNEEIQEDVHLRVRPMDQTIPKTMFPSTASITFWQIELQDGPVKGGILKWEQPIKIVHMCSRKYLAVDKASNELTLCSSHTDPRTVFKLHAVFKTEQSVMKDSYCRIQHVSTGFWLHGFMDKYMSRQQSDSSDNGSMTAHKWSTAELRKVGVIEEKQYDDAFTLQIVEPELLEIFNGMSGMVPFLQKLVEDKKKGIVLTAKMAHDTVSALQEMRAYMFELGETTKQRQKLLRNLQIVEVLVQLLQIPFRGCDDQHHLVRIYVEAYDVLYTYLMGDSRKNELYIAKHIDFFLTQFEIKEGKIGLNAAHMVMELIKDNRKIVDRITHKHIDTFIDLLQRDKNYRYLDLLSVLCVCEDINISDNQKYITEVWLMKGNRNCVFYTDLGQKIGKVPGVVYVSTNMGRTWTELSEFVQRVGTDESYLFLEHQLELYGMLCHGQNEFSIKVITQELNYLTWEEAFTCLSDEVLPDQLRARYCMLITTMFVDISENQAVTDKVKLSYIYAEVDQFEDVVDRTGSTTYQFFPTLNDWISKFLGKNSDMTASEIGNNMLVKQVIRLVHYLVSFGFYYKIDDIKKLLEPLMSLLDGRNDKPYPNISGKDGEEILKHFRKVGRYERSQETKAIVDAKCQALEVLDLFFDFILNQRLEKFINTFKVTHTEMNAPSGFFGHKTELAPMLYSDYDPLKQHGLCKVALKRLADIFDTTSFLKGYNLVDVLKDLTHYKYDEIIRQSLNLLDRYYSAYNDLFSRAVQAQVCITDRSVEVYHLLEKVLPKMRLYASARLSDEQTIELCTILDSLIATCHLDGEEDEPHPVNQTILYNHGIIELCFTILTQKIDTKLLDQYSGQRRIFGRTFILLKLMARLNKLVQNRLFDRLDLLLKVQGVEVELAECIAELFVGNTKTCMKITGKQVQNVMSMVARCKETVPQFLDLLNAVVKVEELDLPIKRNQGFVMQYFMQFRADVAYVIDQDESAREKILMDNSHKDLQYLVAMMDMLATCAEGENQFIESICQTIFKIPELMRIVNNPKVSDNLKRPFLRFILWVYLNSAGGMIESGAGDLPHDKSMWNYIETLNKTLKSVTDYSRENPRSAKLLVKKPPPRVVKQMTRQIIIQGSMHYLFDAVMPFLQIFCKTYYQPDMTMYPTEPQNMDVLARNFKDFMSVIGPLMSDEGQMKKLNACMTTLMSASTLPITEIQEFQEQIGTGNVHLDVRSDSKKAYDSYYEAEDEINNQLNDFSMNMKKSYGGNNTVQAQIGFPSDIPYSEVGGDEELPLGREFQEHLECFINRTAKTPREKYSLASKLVKMMSISSSLTNLSEKEKLDQVNLDIKTLQLLRGLIHNEICKLPEGWEQNSSDHRKQLRVIDQVQDALDNCGAVSSVLDHLSRPQDEVVREVLVFMANLLYNGNESVQVSLIDFFTGTREETFFFSIKGRMTMSAIATREKRHLFAMHQARMEDAIQQAKALKIAMKTGQLATNEITKANNFGSFMSSNMQKSSLNLGSSLAMNQKLGSTLSVRDNTSPKPGTSLVVANGIHGDPPPPAQSPRGGGSLSSSVSVKPPMPNGVGVTSKVSPMVKPVKEEEEEELDEEEIKELLGEDFGQAGDLEFEDDGYIELVLRILGLMCDNQYRLLQDYLREQPDNIKSANLVAETTRFLDILYGSVNSKSMPLICQLFDTLVEFCSGNFANQACVFDNKICDYMNHILRTGVFKGCSHMEVYSLKMSIATVIRAMSEENAPQDFIQTENPLATLAKEVMESVDEHILMKTVTGAYAHMLDLTRASRKEKNDDDYGDLCDIVQDCGFAYFQLLLRKLAIEKGMTKEVFVRTKLDKEAWDFFDIGTMSIEVLKGEDLQTIYFRVRDKSVLREDIKEKFKYEVDRSTPSNKIRGFMDWSSDIMQDIKYQRKVLANPVGRILIKMWIPMNYAALLLSILICSVIMITWRDPKDENGDSDVHSKVPIFSIDENLYYYFLYIAGGMHNFLSVCIYITFLLSNNPSFPPWQAFLRLIGKSNEKEEEFKTWNERKNPYDTNNLELNIYSIKAMYYVVFVACSIMGTIYYGYFFSFHLLHIAELNQLLKRVIQAVTTNGMSLLLVALLGLAIMFIYSLVGFAFLRERFFKESEGRHCRTVAQCFVTITHHGFVDVPYTTFESAMDSDINDVLMLSAIDVTFFILITTIGLNIIFGVIVDTFSQLRDSKWEIDKDMQNNCFICSRESYDFERQGKGFEKHVKSEHNQWAYLFFFIHLDETRPNDYSALELHVYNMLDLNRFEFFPLNRALCLQSDKYDTDEMIEQLQISIKALDMKLSSEMALVEFMASKIREDDAQKLQEREKKKQKEWEASQKTPRE
ncbi:LOW QUALITY PROTEIN: inositol 1,4,5-trisphosphate receptor type 2-like [Pecten maximus]|uniref:LOW QUALITY PROTEIN: inositol 1,4,5-trisphosphate receptor type 2-like n=1 Tax=Pecten maximus TaxID=6579 RepID=UPI001459003B|nr:LOW QUALITY PROTEIN: inositol 1,4,5-trisphosphate receptor type 2-like [Pecten maximus]